MAYNYYQNPYMNYGQNYSVPNPNYQVPQYNQPIMQSAISPINSQQYPTINGKLVESIEVMNAQETPLGGYSVFPMVDFSKVFIKAYDKDGNLQIFKYDLNKSEEIHKEDVYASKLNDIYSYIEKLDKKIDDIKSTRKKKIIEEVDEDE